MPLKFDVHTLLDPADIGRAVREYKQGEVVFSQGGPAQAVFYIRQGMVELTVTSKHGRTAVIGVSGAGEFLGEGCLAGQTHLSVTATTTTDVTIVEVEKSTMMQGLRDDASLAQLFMSFLLLRHIRLEADLAHRIFTPGEEPPPRRIRDYNPTLPA